MTIFILLAFIAIFPILAYLLANQTTNKGMIFGLSLIVISLCLIIFVSKFSVIGSYKKQVLNNEILEEIYIDSKISKSTFVGIESLLQDDEIQVWLISFIGKAIELNKLNSAESLITYAEKFFTTNEFSGKEIIDSILSIDLFVSKKLFVIKEPQKIKGKPLDDLLK